MISSFVLSFWSGEVDKESEISASSPSISPLPTVTLLTQARDRLVPPKDARRPAEPIPRNSPSDSLVQELINVKKKLKPPIQK